jgi:hypothetical protein
MSRALILALCAAIAVGVSASQAAVRLGFDEPLGNSGWRVQGPGYAELQLAIDAEGETHGIKWVAISISKNFRFGPDPFTGLYPAIELDFMQMDGVHLEDLATRIIITSELVNNSTDTDWFDYHWRLFGHGIASFNRELTNPTGEVSEDGWLISPFDQYAWSTDHVFGTEELSVWDGVVPNGDAFFPGSGSGSLVIDINLVHDSPHDSPAIFKFWQAPTPEPATLTLLALGGAVVTRRRRT